MRRTFPCPRLPTINVPSAVDVMLSGKTRVPGRVISVTFCATQVTAAIAITAAVRKKPPIDPTLIFVPPSACELRAYQNIYIPAADDGRHEALAVDAELTKALRHHQEIELHPVEHVENKAGIVGGQESGIERDTASRRLLRIDIDQPIQPAFLPFTIVCRRFYFVPASVDSEYPDKLKCSKETARALQGGLTRTVPLLRPIV